MSSNTHATKRIPKKINRPPGSLVGPMCLPLSYNVKDYDLNEDGTVSRSQSSIDSEKKSRRHVKGALRYRRNRLLDAEPIE